VKQYDSTRCTAEGVTQSSLKVGIDAGEP